jgi:signal transduction histidine kinase
MFVQAEVIPLPRVGAFFFGLKNPAFELKFALVMAVVYFLFWESWPAWLIFQSMLIYAATIAWLRQRGKLDKLPIDVVYLFWLIVSAFLYGANEGQHAFNATDRDYELTLQAGSTMDANLLRATSDFFIVMEQPSEILVVPRSDVKLLKRKNLTPPHALISLPGVWRWLQSKMGGGTT